MSGCRRGIDSGALRRLGVAVAAALLAWGVVGAAVAQTIPTDGVSAELKQTICDVLEVGAGECASLTDIHSSGHAPWYIEGSALRSGDISNNQSSCLNMRIASGGVVQQLQAEMRVSSERGWDNLKFYVNGEEKARRSDRQVFSVTEDSVGENPQLRWCYEKDGSVSNYEDAGWLSRLQIQILRVESGVETSLSGSGRDISVTIVSRIATGDRSDVSFDVRLSLVLLGDLEFPDDGGTDRMYDFNYAGATSATFVVHVPVHFTSERGGTLELTLSGDVIPSASERLSLSPPDLGLELQAPADVVNPAFEDFEVQISARAPGAASFDDAVSATLIAELEGAAVFVLDSTIVSSVVETIQLTEEFTTHTLHVRLNSDGATSRLRLALVVGGIATSATTLLLAGVRSLQSLLIAAPTSINIPGLAVWNMEMSLRAIDNFGRLWPQDLAATLTAELIGEAVFVDESDNDAGTMRTSPVSITAGEVTRTLRFRMTAADASATLRLRLAISGQATNATVELQVVPRALARVVIETEERVMATALTAPVRHQGQELLFFAPVPLSLKAFDNYGDDWPVSGALFSGEIEGVGAFAIGRSIRLNFSYPLNLPTDLDSLNALIGKDSDVRLKFTLSVGSVASSVTVNVITPNSLQSLSLEVPAEVLRGDAGGPVEVVGLLHAFDIFDEESGFEVTLRAELHGDAVFAGGGGRSTLTRTIQVAGAGGTTSSLFVELNGVDMVTLELVAEAGDFSVRKETRLLPFPRTPRTFRIVAPDVARASPMAPQGEILVNVRFEALDNYNDAYFNFLLFFSYRAELTGAAEFDDLGRTVIKGIRDEGVELSPRLTSDADATLSVMAEMFLADSADTGPISSATVTIQLLSTARRVNHLEIHAPREAQATEAFEILNVSPALLVLDNYNDVWTEALTATLSVALEGAAAFVGGDGMDMPGETMTRMVRIESGESTTSLHVRLTSDADAILTLTLSLDGLSASGKVNLRAARKRLQTLVIEAPTEMSTMRASEILMVPVSLVALDNYAEDWSQDVDATLTAELIGAAEFVDDAGGGIGNMRSIPISIAAGATMTSLHLRLSSSAGATLSLSLAADGATSAEAEVDLRAVAGVLSSLTIEASARLEQSAPRADVDVEVSLKAFDSYGAAWPQDVDATLTAQLTGGAMFVDVAGVVIGERDTEALSIMAGEAAHSLRVRLSDAVNANLALTLEAEGLSAAATVSLIAVPAALSTLTIDVQDEIEATQVRQVIDLTLTLGALDNYGRIWREDVAATLTANLAGGAMFIDNSGDVIGTDISDALSMRTGELEYSLQSLKLVSHGDSTLQLTLSAEGRSAAATVRLRAVPRVLRALQLNAEVEVEQMTAGEAVAVTFQLAATDNYGDAFATQVALVAQALDSHLARVQLVGEALSSSGSFLIAGGEAAVEVEALPSPGRSFSLQLEARAGDISDRAVTLVAAAPSLDSRLVVEGPSQLVLDADGRGGFDLTLRAVDVAIMSNVAVQGVRLGVADNARVSVSFDTTSTLDLTTEGLNVHVTVDSVVGLADIDLTLLATHDTLIDGELLVRLLRGPETLDVTQDQKLDTEDLIVIARYLHNASMDADGLLRNLKMPSAAAAVVIENLNRLRMNAALDLDGDGDGDGVDVRLLLRYGLGLGEALLSADFDEAKARALLSGQ